MENSTSFKFDELDDLYPDKGSTIMTVCSTISALLSLLVIFSIVSYIGVKKS
jgi:hypothetical protein